MIHYTFKLTFETEETPGSTAKVRLVECSTLTELADVLLAAINFDLDHAFGFHSDLKNPYAKNMKREYTVFADQGDPRMASDTGVEDTTINDVFKERTRMLFHFDYGDDWMFLVECITIEKTPSRRRRPQILEVIGAFPEQYPDYEEDEGEDDEIRVGINVMTGERIELPKKS
jgi:hypothetical protein